MFNILWGLVVVVGVTIASDKVYKIPENFKFGVATAAYQIEGGWNASGKGQNIWDNLTHSKPDYTVDHTNGDIACDSYHKWKEDVAILKEIGVNHYRFSISWSRILPTGFTNVINPDGIRYYNNLIDELRNNGIEPLVTIFHFDLPQPLQDLGGLASKDIAVYFVDYARVLFKYFGDRVKYWLTFNEPYTYCGYGYKAIFAPMVNSDGLGMYLCGRTLLVAHGRVYRMYEKEFKKQQGGKLGMTVNTYWLEPKTKSKEDIDAQTRGLNFYFGWWMNPVYSKDGNYPKEMIDRVAYVSKGENFSESRLPPLSDEEVNYIRGSYDFFGMNYYTARTIKSNLQEPYNPPSIEQDIGGKLEVIPNTEQAGVSWLQVYPKGIRELLNYVRVHYNNPPVLITENGYTDTDGRICDYRRISFIQKHLIEVMKAMNEDGCNVMGYTYWSFIDDFEWMSGYSQKFGLVRVDFNSPNRTRTMKMSAEFYKQLIKTRLLPTGDIEKTCKENN